MNSRTWSHRDHRSSLDSLSAYVDGELSVRETARIESHLAGCAACQDELAALRHTKLLLRAAPSLPVPRSFVLPLSMARKPQLRIWQNSFVFLRGAAVALTLLLVILLSGNAVLTSGVLPFADAPQAEPVGEATVMVAEPVLEAVAADVAPAEQAMPAPELEQAPPAEPLALLSATAPQPGSGPVPRAMAAGKLSDEQSAAPAEEPVALEEPSKASPADQRGPLTALAAAPRPPTPAGAQQSEAMATVNGEAGGVGGGSLPVQGAEPAVGAALPEPTPQPQPVAEAQAQPTATAEPQPTPTQVLPTETPTAVAVAALVPTEPQPVEPPRALAVPNVSQPKAGFDAAAYQRALRIGSGVLFGLLLMVGGGLLWTNHKRRA